MQALALADDLIVFISRVWQTSATAFRAHDRSFLIDSPVYPDELAALPGVLAQANFDLQGLFVTHADWDHLLARLAFPETPLALGESSAARLLRDPDAAQRELCAFDQEHYVEREVPPSFAGMRSLPLPGRLKLGSERELELELHPAAGHTADGTAFWIGWRAALICGDYLSPVEIPMLGAGGSLAEYLATLDRLEPIVARARHVIPGHGRPLGRERAQAILAQDRDYLLQLASTGDAALPAGRSTARQQQIHQANRAALALASPC